ncbi:MAG: hypothetical protein ABIR52_14150 [Casimicrobiaceae bacterium]
MKNGYRPAIRAVAAGLALAAYVMFSHYASSAASKDGGRFAVVVVCVYAAIALAFAWRSRHRYAWILLCLGLAALAWRHIDAIGDHAAWVYFVQHAGGNALLAVVFGRTLVAGRVPLCTRIAAFVHDPMEPRLVRYTRHVTLAWALFFSVNAAISAVLFALAPVVVWSVFANLLDLPLVALMFAVEYGVRHRVLPNMKHASIFEAIRRYIHLSRASQPPAA